MNQSLRAQEPPTIHQAFVAMRQLATVYNMARVVVEDPSEENLAELRRMVEEPLPA